MKTNLGIRLDMGHLKDVVMGYFEHLIGAYKLAFRFLLGTVQLLIHGLIPNLFVDAGKKTHRMPTSDECIHSSLSVIDSRNDWNGVLVNSACFRP